MVCSLMANKLNLRPAGFRVDHMPSGKTTAKMSGDIFNTVFSLSLSHKAVEALLYHSLFNL